MKRTEGATACFQLVLFLLLMLGAPEVPAQAWCGDDCVNVNIDASLGMEALEEPNRDAAAAEQEPSQTTGYANVFVSGLFQIYQLQMVLAAPLRFDMSDFGIREADWDEADDFFRILPCVRLDFMGIDDDYGRSQNYRFDENGSCGSWVPTEAVGDVFREPWDFTYVSLRFTPLNNFTLGNGSIVAGYIANLEENQYREGVAVEINLDRTFVFNAGLSDILNPTVLAGRMAFRPVDSETAGQFAGDTSSELYTEIGLTAATDVRAPTLLNSGGEVKEEAIVIGGVDATFRYSSVNDYSRDSYRIIRFEAGGRFNQIFDRDYGVNANLRFYYDIGTVDFYVDGEYRMLKGRYVNNYFNPHYRVQRSQYPLSEAQRQGFDRLETQFTKLDFLNNLPDDTDHAYSASFRMRFWPWDEERSAWTRDGADFWIFIEDVPNRVAAGRAGTGLEFPNIADRLRIWGEFVQQGWDTFGQIFTLQNSVFNLQSRIQLTDSIYLDLYFKQTWYLFENGSFDSANDLGFDVGFLQGL